MGIGFSVVLLALGALLVWAVRGGGSTAVGVVLLILGAVVALLSLVVALGVGSGGRSRSSA